MRSILTLVISALIVLGFLTFMMTYTVRFNEAAVVTTFGGGTNEIQRDIIAMLGLGMPRAPR